MKMAKSAVLAGVLALCCGASAVVTVIPENGTFYVGGDGTSGAPYNTHNSFIVFNPGSTLVVTQTTALTVWSILIATNGAATLEFGSGTSPHYINSHVFACGNGSLKVKSSIDVSLGHALYFPTYDIENLTIEGGSGKFVLQSCTMLSFPSSKNYLISRDGGNIWLCGTTDMFPDDDEVVLTRARWYLASPTAVPASKPIHVTGEAGYSPAKFTLCARPLPDTSDIAANYPEDIRATYNKKTVITNSNNIVLDIPPRGTSTMVISNRADIVFAGSLSGTGVVEVTGWAGAFSAAAPLTVGLTGDSSSLHGKIVLAQPNIDLKLGHPHATGEALVIPATSGSTIYGTEGGTAKVDAGQDGITATLADAGTFELVSPDWAFTNHVAHWYDFSRVEMYRFPGEGTSEPHQDYLDGNPLVERVLDWRSPDLTSMWNRRMYKNDGTYDYVASVYPCRKTATFGEKSMSYLSLPTGNFRRLPISPGSGSNTRLAVQVQMAVMVFGSQYGGGNALLGTDNGSLGRTGATIADGITTNTSHAVWVDGVQVDPTQGNVLNGGWQIISMKLDGEPVDAVGWNNWIKDNSGGGQNYGELILFTKPVTERQRIEAEMYLAEKWGLSSQYVPGAEARHDWLVQMDHTNKVTVTGSATVKAGEYAIMMDGACSGSVVLEGGTLLSGKRPWKESEIPSAGRIYWLDACDRSTLSLRGDVDTVPTNGRTNEVYAVRDKGSQAYEAGKPIAYGVNWRKPTWYEASFDGGPLRGWLDFNQYYKQWPATAGSPTDGNCLRFYEYADDFSIKDGKRSSTGSAPGYATLDTRTAFVAQNSVRGGGTPLLDNLSNNGSVAKRLNGPGQSIWSTGPAEFANGVNRINGVGIDPTKGYTGKPEVFSVRGTGSVNLPFIEGLYHSEGASYGTTYESGKAAIIGEMLWYSTALDDDTMVGIESYLMKKWLDKVPPGFTDILKVNVEGTGTVSVVDAACRPMFDTAFEGTFATAGTGAFEMTVDPATGNVAGAITAPEAAFDIPSTCTLQVGFTELPAISEGGVTYTLVDCASLARPVEWNVVLDATAPRRARVVESQSGRKVDIVVTVPGMRVLLR